MQLEGKVAVITGGASGMGQSTALRFLNEGAKVVVIDCACSAFGRLDIVFNNAGVGGAVGPVWEIDVADWDYTFDMLVKGVFLGIKHASRAMKQQGEGGAIINTASIAGLSGGEGLLVYSAAKAAVVNLTKAAALQLAPDRIRVNAICPGGIVTPLTHRGNLEAMGQQMDTLQPWPEHGTGDHIAGTALFLAGNDAVFVTGEALVVDGGLTAAGPEIWKRFGRESEATYPRVGVNRGSTGELGTRRDVTPL